MAFPTKLSQLCTPALVYFIISILGIVITIFQNMQNQYIYSLGNFSCRVPSTMLVFVIKVAMVLFWTWVLNLMCKDGHEEISWFLVLLPFISIFMVMALVAYNR